MADSQISSRENRKNGAPLSPEEKILRDERRRQAKERNLFEIQHYGGRSFVARCEATRPDFEMLQQLDYFYNMLKGRAGEVNGVPFEEARAFIDRHTDLLVSKSDLCRDLAKVLNRKYREPQLISDYRKMRAKQRAANPQSNTKKGSSKSGQDNRTAAPAYENTAAGDSKTIQGELAIPSFDPVDSTVGNTTPNPA